jgi:hypothetical protein
MSRMRTRSSTLVMLLLTVGSGCGGGMADTAAVADSAGISLITYPGARTALGWTLDTVRVLGGAESGPQGFYRVNRALVDVDALGRIYVLDPALFRVIVFDSTGDFVREFGRKGEGPGELTFPISVTASDQGEVLVFDGDKGALVSFLLYGDGVQQHPFPYSVMRMGFSQVQLEPGALVFWSHARFESRLAGGESLNRFLRVSGSDTTPLLPAFPDQMAGSRFEKCGMTVWMRIPLSPFPRWSQWGSRLAAAVWPEYRVDMFEAGKAVWSLRFGESTPELSEAEAVAMFKASGNEGGPCGSTSEDLVKRYGFSKRPQMVRSLALSPDGGAWVEVGIPGRERHIDLFDSAGRYRGSMGDSFPMPLTFLPSGALLIQVTDSFDIQRLGIVRVIGA